MNKPYPDVHRNSIFHILIYINIEFPSLEVLSFCEVSVWANLKDVNVLKGYFHIIHGIGKDLEQSSTPSY